MTIPFAGLFQKLRSGFRSPASSGTLTAEPVHTGPIEKKSGEDKLSKTVLPNTTRTLAPLDPFDIASGASARSTGGAASRTTGSSARPAGLPPAVAFALEPKVERTISLQLSDVIAAAPAEYIKPIGASEATRRVLLKAAEIEKGMAIGKPAISLLALYEQVPEIFLRRVPETELMHVPLPMDKVLEQITSVRVRTDQERDQVVPQVDTPILQATIEDTKKFGTAMAPIQTSDMPPVKVEPASAQALAAAEPEALREAKAPAGPAGSGARAPIPLSVPMPPKTDSPAAVNPPNEPDKPTRVPFQLPPNGTDVPASERVPASSGPSVPIRSSRPPGAPFKLPPSDSLRPKLTLVPGVEPAGAPAEDEDLVQMPVAPAKPKEPTLSLRLQPILVHLAPFQLNGSPSSVPHDVEVQLPLSLIQPQLAVGRVSIAPKVFQAAMPRQYRDLIVIDSSETPIALPLHEVLKKIPSHALRMRPDQEEPETGESFETPFSLKAKEDAERFKASDQPVAKPAQLEPTAEPKDAPAEEAKVSAAMKASQSDQAENAIKAALQSAGGTEGDATASKADKPAGENAAEFTPEEPSIDAKEVVARASRLPGVVGCVITFADGLSLAGNLPEEYAVGGLCAMAPSLLQRIEKHMLDTKLGAMNALTLRGENSALSFFRHGSIYLAALHDGKEQLSPETHSELFTLTRDLSRSFAQPENTHVDH